MIKWLTLGIAIIALTFTTIACVVIHQQANRINEAETALYASIDEAMTSVADSFKLNRLDYSLQWKTKNGAKVRMGVFSE